MTLSVSALFLAVFAAAFAGAIAFSGSVSPQLECALCGLAVNEVEGLIQENKTSAQIIQAIEDDICSHLSGDLKALCDQVAQLAPVIVDKLIDHETAGSICIDVKLCAGPRNDRPDPIAMPKSTPPPPLSPTPQPCFSSLRRRRKLGPAARAALGRALEAIRRDVQRTSQRA